MNLFTKKKIILLFGALLIFAKFCTANELSLNGIVPTAGNANGFGWTAGTTVGGLIKGGNFEMFFGGWAPLEQNTNAPIIAINALVFPENNSIIFATQLTNITWFVEKITDNIDGTNLNISKISLHYADSTNFILEVTNNIQNMLGEIEWDVPPVSWDGNTNYVLKFEVVDSSSLTNSRVFWDNKFIIVPEPGFILLEFTALACLFFAMRNGTKKCTLF